jgi:anaphase-promoting complex subunit 5
VKSREEQLRDRALGITEDSEEQPIGEVMRFARQSPLGTFVRRARMEYMKCQFDDSVALWRAFIQYRMPTYHVWAKRNPVESGQINIDSNLVDLGLEMNSPLARAVYGEYSASEEVKTGRSTKDVEMLLEFQVSEMQSEFPCRGVIPVLILTIETGSGSRVTAGLKAQLQKLIESGATVPSLSHYIK